MLSLRLLDYAPGTVMQDALSQLKTAVGYKCASFYKQAVAGADLGLGPQLYNSTTNYKAAVVRVGPRRVLDARVRHGALLLKCVTLGPGFLSAGRWGRPHNLLACCAHLRTHAPH